MVIFLHMYFKIIVGGYERCSKASVGKDELDCVFVRKLWRSLSSSGVSGRCHTLVRAEGRRARPIRSLSNCRSRCLHSFYSGAANTNIRSSWKWPKKYAFYTTRNVSRRGYLSASNGELLLALFTLSGLIIFQPGMALMGTIGVKVKPKKDVFLDSPAMNEQWILTALNYLQGFVNLLKVLHLEFGSVTKMMAILKSFKCEVV